MSGNSSTMKKGTVMRQTLVDAYEKQHTKSCLKNRVQLSEILHYMQNKVFLACGFFL